MNAFITIEADEFESFGRQIGAGTELIRTVSARMVTKIGDDAVAFARQQPPPPRGYKMQFKSARQRRWFFSALRSGAIKVPYQRTGSLTRGWLVRIKLSGDTFTAEVYNNVPYKKYVQGFGNEQAHIHQGRWSTQERIAEAARQAAPPRAREAESELERLFLLHLGKR